LKSSSGGGKTFHYKWRGKKKGKGKTTRKGRAGRRRNQEEGLTSKVKYWQKAATAFSQCNSLRQGERTTKEGLEIKLESKSKRGKMEKGGWN